MIVVSVNQYERTDGIGYGPLPPESAPVDVRRRRLRRRGRPTVCRRHGVTVAAVGGLSGVRGEKGGGERTKTTNTVRAFPRPGSTTPSCDTYSGPWSHTRLLPWSSIIIINYRTIFPMRFAIIIARVLLDRANPLPR